MTFEWIRFIAATLFIAFGIVFFILAALGVFRLKFVLNRMHAAAMGDTLGILSCLVGLMLICGFSFATLKLLLIILFFWLASPVASHLISRLEVTTNEKLEKDCEVRK